MAEKTSKAPRGKKGSLLENAQKKSIISAIIIVVVVFVGGQGPLRPALAPEPGADAMVPSNQLLLLLLVVRQEPMVYYVARIAIQ